MKTSIRQHIASFLKGQNSAAFGICFSKRIMTTWRKTARMQNAHVERPAKTAILGMYLCLAKEE